MIKVLDNVILYKANAQFGGKELAETHGAPGYPTFLVMDPKGELLGKWSGYGKAAFLSNLDQSMVKMK